MSGVRDFCETLVLLDGCSGVRPLDLSERVMGWKQDESGTGEIVLILVKLEKESNILFWRKFTLTSPRDVGFKHLVVNMALC